MLICLFALVGNRHGEVQITSSISSVGGGFSFWFSFQFLLSCFGSLLHMCGSEMSPGLTQLHTQLEGSPFPALSSLGFPTH